MLNVKKFTRTRVLAVIESYKEIYRLEKHIEHNILDEYSKGKLLESIDEIKVGLDETAIQVGFDLIMELTHGEGK